MRRAARDLDRAPVQRRDARRVRRAVVGGGGGGGGGRGRLGPGAVAELAVLVRAERVDRAVVGERGGVLVARGDRDDVDLRGRIARGRCS